MADLIRNFVNKRKIRSPTPSDELSISPECKKTKQQTSPGKELIQEEDKVLTALSMAQDFGSTLQEILKKLEKLDVIESSLLNIQRQLGNLERRTQELEAFQSTTKKDIVDLKDVLSFIGDQATENANALVTAKDHIAELSTKVQENKDMVNEQHNLILYMEVYSRRENIKFMNIKEETTVDGKEDTEEVLRSFLERDLGYADARSVELQRVHRNGKGKDGKPRPILALFLRYKDVQAIFALGQRLKDTEFQIFRDYPVEIIERRRSQMEAFKATRKNGIPASFSNSQPDKLYIRGKLWPKGKVLSTP